jgi:CRISPR-associated protein Cmr3
MGKITLRGPFLWQNDRRIYPWPLNLLQRHGQNGGKSEFARLQVGSPLHTHLGRVRVPMLAGQSAGFKVPESTWIVKTGLEAVLAGAMPASDQIVSEKELYAEEVRLGIALKNRERTVDDGRLYQTRHIRLRAGVFVDLDVDGIDELCESIFRRPKVLRLGGEGRMAGVSIHAADAGLPDAPTPQATDRGVILVLLTPAALNENSWLPGKFTEEVDNGVSTWRGHINGIEMRIHAAVIGKSHREGGWDMAAREPRAVQSLVPAGSLWYCTMVNSDLRAAYSLHGAQIGGETELGRGLIAVGRWPAQEFNE